MLKVPRRSKDEIVDNISTNGFASLKYHGSNTLILVALIKMETQYKSNHSRNAINKVNINIESK